MATDPDAARYAVTLVRAEYEVEAHQSDLHVQRAEAYEPKEKRSGISPPPSPRGDAQTALRAAPMQVEHEYYVPVEHHNPMEMHATTVIWEGDGGLTIYDKTQGVQNTHAYVCSVFGLSKDKVRVVSPYVGGAFGSGLRPQYQLSLAVMAATELERSVRVVLTRDQMFTFGYRPETIQKLSLGAGREGTLQAIMHEAVANTSQFEDYQEVVVNWAGLLYQCDNVTVDYKLAQLDRFTPCDMRAPGRRSGCLGSKPPWTSLPTAPASTRSSCGSSITPRPTRTRTSRSPARLCAPATRKVRRGSAGRSATPRPRSMRMGAELVGWGMATGVWEAHA